jgi:three-Cys-motif partner protein
MTQDAFAGRHTEQKLEALEKYLNAYTTALKKQPFRLIYFDGFAGTGSIPFPSNGDESLFPVGDYEEVVKGSIERALKFPFSEFHFVEKSKKKSSELQSYCKLNHPDKTIFIQNCDANDALREFIDQFNPKSERAIIFLDPYGNQVSMDTFRYLARKPGLDIWYLFPAGLGVNRQIGKSGSVHEEHEKSLDRLFGGSDWQDELITEVSEPDLFESNITIKMKSAGANKITELMISRLKIVFGDRVLGDWLPLGRGRHHWYSLIFMWSNPAIGADLAGKLAKAVLKSTKKSGSR